MSSISTSAQSSFHSLRTGKPIQRHAISHTLKEEDDSFPFPSTGKAYPKTYPFTIRVILPKFPFPSTGKAYPKPTPPAKQDPAPRFHSLQPGKPIQRVVHSGSKYVATVCFHSLPPGKPIQSWCDTPYTSHTPENSFHSLPPGKPIQSGKIILTSGYHTFPFPSTGKAYPKTASWTTLAIGRCCFHSLQPGKPIQSGCRRAVLHARLHSFHSLQPGKPIQSLMKV